MERNNPAEPHRQLSGFLNRSDRLRPRLFLRKALRCRDAALVRGGVFSFGKQSRGSAHRWRALFCNPRQKTVSSWHLVRTAREHRLISRTGFAKPEIEHFVITVTSAKAAIWQNAYDRAQLARPKPMPSNVNPVTVGSL